MRARVSSGVDWLNVQISWESGPRWGRSWAICGGKQLKMPFVVTQVQKKDGEQNLVLLYPEEVATGKVVFPIPGWQERK